MPVEKKVIDSTFASVKLKFKSHLFVRCAVLQVYLSETKTIENQKASESLNDFSLKTLKPL